MTQRSPDDPTDLGARLPVVTATAHRLPTRESLPHSGAAESDAATPDAATLVRGTQRLTISGSMSPAGTGLPEISATAIRVEGDVRAALVAGPGRTGATARPGPRLPTLSVGATRIGTAAPDHETGQ